MPHGTSKALFFPQKNFISFYFTIDFHFIIIYI